MLVKYRRPLIATAPPQNIQLSTAIISLGFCVVGYDNSNYFLLTSQQLMEPFNWKGRSSESRGQLD